MASLMPPLRAAHGVFGSGALLSVVFLAVDGTAVAVLFAGQAGALTRRDRTVCLDPSFAVLKLSLASLQAGGFARGQGP